VLDARMGGGELAARGKALVATLAAELKALDVPPEVPGGTSMAQVGAAAEVVKHGATKIQMLFADGADVPGEAADAMLQDFHGHIVGFLAYATSALGSQGATFDAGVADAARLVSNSCANLVAVATATRAPSPELKPALAEVWAACDALKKLPKNGRAAVSKALMRSAAVVKDVAAELAEIGASGDEDVSDEKENEPESVSLRHEDDMMFEDGDFDAEELRVARACGAFAQASFEFLKALVSPIVRRTSEDASETEALETALRECRLFQRYVEEVGAGAYPPQALEALAADARAAMERAQAMGRAVGEAGDAQAAAEATAAFEAAHETLASVVEES
jgi:hypothetical protein